MTSKFRFLFNGQSMATLLLALASSAAWASPAISIRFHGESTLHGFDGHVETAEIRIEDSPQGLRRLVTTVSVPAMTTDHAGRDRRMVEMFHGASFPLITGSALAADLAAVEEGGDLPLELVIGGQTNTVTATCRMVPVEGAAEHELSFPVSLRAFDLKAPSVIGVIRVSDTVDVTARLNAEAWSMVKEGAR